VTHNRMVVYGVGVVGASLPVLSPRERVAGGCCLPVVRPDLAREDAAAMAAVLKALGDPTRLLIVDALRKSAPEALCQCELTPLFDMTQQALSKHLKVLVGAGVVGSEKRGLWTYYFLLPRGLEEVRSWLS
jgi:ArsR family transcriptional regulator, arsenate/arsenite/antimonite-responsive transcriptional repressor